MLAPVQFASRLVNSIIKVEPAHIAKITYGKSTTLSMLLYVDGAEVAQDAASLSGLATAEGGLHLGVGSALAPGTFFSGLIDDVRIYNRAGSP